MNYNFKVNGARLSLEQHQLLTNFILNINKPSLSYLIYRGESIENLREKLNIQPFEDLNQRLNYFIFSIGEKGRIYQENYSTQLRERSTFSIKDCSSILFKYIFNKINHVITKSKNEEILEFKRKNIEFSTYFTDKKNSEKFVTKVENLSSRSKIEIRDYYLEFLHKVGYMGFYLNTFFLSTSKSKEIAKSFSSQKDIIFVSWRSKKRSEEQSVKNNGLPLIENNIYTVQKEITLKGALFPQDIPGFIERETNTFNVNPNLFLYPDLLDYMVKYGIPIDQTNFEEIKNETKYSGSITRNGEKFNDEIKNQ